MSRITNFELRISEKGKRQQFSPELEYTIRWFERRLIFLHRENARLDNSLFIYRAGFWALVLVLVAFVIGVIVETM